MTSLTPSPLSGMPRLSSAETPASESAENISKWARLALLMVYLL